MGVRRQRPQGLCSGEPAGIDALGASRLEEERNVEERDPVAAGAAGFQETGFLGRDERMDDRFKPPQRVLLPDDPFGQALAVDLAVRRNTGKRRVHRGCG